MKTIIIGAGIGGLSAALHLAKNGFDVCVVEATESYGGLAKRVNVNGFDFDAGPYVLLDKPGLSWAFNQLDLSLSALKLNKIQQVYAVESNNAVFNIGADMEATVSGIDAVWKGQGKNYRRFVNDMYAKYNDLQPFTFQQPNKWNVLKSGKFRLIPFMFSSLGAVLDSYKFNETLKNGIGIWTNIAAQSLHKAPSPMAFVPGLIHNIGAYYPDKGIGSIADLLHEACLSHGVEFRFNARVDNINTSNAGVTGITLENKQTIPADCVMSNSNAIGTYVNLIDKTPAKYVSKLKALPLQSPGICVFLRVKRNQVDTSYIQFKLDDTIPNCKSFIIPDAINYSPDEWKPARLIFPLPHDYSLKLTDEECNAIIQKVLNEDWWKKGITDYEVLSVNTPTTWETKFVLYNKSMNPVMTSKFMREGRIKHKSPYFKGLYFTGSSTHPGQWVSFCAVSGILAAREIIKDYA